MRGYRKIGLAGFVVILSMMAFMPSVQASPVFMTDTQILRFTDDYGADLWTPYPADGIFWDKVWGYDENATYMQSPVGALPQSFTTLSDWIDPDWTGERIYVSYYARGLSYGTGTSTTTIAMSVPTYGTGTFLTYQTFPTSVYTNKTYSYGSTCPATKTPWNETILTTFWITFLRISGNQTRITDFAFIVQTTAWSVDPTATDHFEDWAELGIATVSGFATMALSVVFSPLALFSGLIWIFSSLTTFIDLGIGWMTLTLGLGMYVLGDGAFKWIEGRNK